MLPVRNAGVGASAADTSLPGLEAGVLGQGAGGRRARGRCFLSARSWPLPCCPRRRAVSSGFLVSPRLISTPSIVGHLPAPHPHQDVPKAQHHSKATLPNAVPSGLGLQHTDPGGHTRSVRDVLSTLQHISALVLRWRGWPSPACDDPPPSSLCRAGGHLIPAEAEPRAPTAPSASHTAFWATRLAALTAHSAPGRVPAFTSLSPAKCSATLLAPGILLVFRWADVG